MQSSFAQGGNNFVPKNPGGGRVATGFRRAVGRGWPRRFFSMRAFFSGRVTRLSRCITNVAPQAPGNHISPWPPLKSS